MNKVIGPIALSYIRHIYEYSYLNNFENSIYEQNRNLRNFNATFTNINGAKKFVTCSTIPALVHINSFCRWSLDTMLSFAN